MSVLFSPTEPLTNNPPLAELLSIGFYAIEVKLCRDKGYYGNIT